MKTSIALILFVADVLWGGGRPMLAAAAETPGAPPAPPAAQPAVNLGEPPATATRLKLSTLELDMGEVAVDESRVLNITVENPTDAPITVKDLHASCGCTEVKLPQPVIAPAASATLEVKYTGRFGHKVDAISVTFTTDEKNKPAVKITVHATVKQELTVEPAVLQFDHIRKGESKVLEAVIKSVDGKPFAIERAAAYNKEFSLKWTPVEGGNGAAYKLSVTATGLASGPVSETVRVMTDRPKGGVAQLYLNAAVSGDLVLTPEVISAQLGNDGIVAPFEMTVKRLSPGTLEVQGLTDTRGLAVEFTAKPLDESSVHLTIRLKDPYVGRPPVGQFRLQTNVESKPIPVPYRIRAEGGIPAAVPGAATKLKVNPTELDTGEVPFGESRDMTVNLENPTDKPIALRDLHTTCGCVGAQLSAATVAPGKTETLHARFTSIFGMESKTVSVLFNTDEDNSPEVRITVNAKVRREFTAEPGTLQFEHVNKGETRSLAAVIKSVDGKPFTIQEATPVNKEFVCKWTPVEAGNGAAQRVEVTFTGSKGGSVAEMLRVVTDRPVGGIVPLHLFGTVIADVSFAPEPVFADMTADGVVAPFETVAKRTTPGKLEIMGVSEARQLAVEYTVKQLDESSAQLTIRLKNPFRQRAPLGQFWIQTNVEANSLPLPFRIRGPAARQQEP